MAYDDVITRNDDGELAVRTVSVSEGNAPANYDDVMTRDEDGNLAVRVIGNGGGGGGSSKSVPQYETMPTASSANLGVIAQYKGETDSTYTNGYFYKSVIGETMPSTISIEQYEGIGVVPSVDKTTFETQITTTGTYDFTYNGSSWTLDGSPVNIANYGITYTEEQQVEIVNIVGQNIEDAYINDGETFISAVGASGTYRFEYNGSAWELNGNVVNPSDYGLTILELPTQYEAYQAGSNVFPYSLGEISVDIDTFVGMVGEAKPYTFTYVTDHWVLNDGQTEQTVDLTDYGITFDGSPNPEPYIEVDSGGTVSFSVDMETFLTATDTDPNYLGELMIGYNGSNWWGGDSSNIISLATYGISIIDGTPQDGDEYLIRYVPAYTVPSDDDSFVVYIYSIGGFQSGDYVEVSCEKGLDAGEVLRVDYTQASSPYTWEETKVQRDSGIDWAGHWDKPENEYITWQIFPYYSVSQLPDGHYEFYAQSLYNSTNNEPFYCRTRTFKVDFNVWTDEWSNREIRGYISWVLDGSTSFNAVEDGGLSQDISAAFYNKDNVDTLCCPAGVWISYPMFTSAEMPNVFRWTNVRNIDTGEEFEVEFSVSENNYIPSSFGNRVGNEPLGMRPWVSEPVSPEYWYRTTIPIRDNVQYLTLPLADNGLQQSSECRVYGNMGTGNEISVTFIQNSNGNLDVKVLKATGVFANPQVGAMTNSDRSVVLFLNTPLGTEGTATFFCGVSGSIAMAGVWYLEDYDGSDFEQIGVKSVGYPVLKENLGAIDQYLGETDANYTNGYFYKATGTKTVTPAEAVCTQTEGPTQTTITITDADAFINMLVAKTGWTRTDVVFNLQNGSNIFRYRANNNRIYWENVGSGWDYNDFSSFLTFSPMPASGNTYFTVAYTPEVITITNGHWERVDVQPNLESISGYDASKTQTLKNVQGVLTWVDDQ